MTRTDFDLGWTVRPKGGMFSDLFNSDHPAQEVVLPHDAMLALSRAPEHGPSSGYHPGGAVEYSRSFEVPEEWRRQRVTLEFQGVYRDAVVLVNGQVAGQRRNGYARFHVALDPFLRYGEVNTVRVDARAHQDSRWYSGLGMHRDVVLIRTPLVHLVTDGVRITTPEVDDELAVVEVAVAVRNEDVSTRRRRVLTRILATDGAVLTEETLPVTMTASGTAVVRHRLVLRNPMRWDVDRPHLYRARVEILDDGQRTALDSTEVAFGVRTLRLDPVHGLRINGTTVKLRGACIHHDNGPLGAAAIARAEERRVELLKQAGFNAIRSAHNPLSPAMLDACDRLGMLVMDEAFDVWLEAKTPFDYSLDFPEWWERDLESMVAKDFNHPSVVLYSVGNEIPDTGRLLGGAWGRRLAEQIRSLDPTRYVTNAVSGFVSVIGEVLDEFRAEVGGLRTRGVNDVASELTEVFDRIGASELVTDRTEEAHGAVDVAGLNYADFRFQPDGERFPNRVMVGSETYPGSIDVGWALVSELPNVIGDFTWTGWDYLGEVGLGRTDYPEQGEAPAQDPDHPWLLAWCGDLDITGYRRPASYYREIVFGLRHEPYIAVRRPEHHGRRRVSMQWAWSDAVSSWTWAVPVGSPTEVEVYSDADHVELLLDGMPLGRAATGRRHRFRAVFEVPYRPGTLTAVARTRGVETGRTELRTAGKPSLQVSADRSRIRADPQDLAFVAIELRDAFGVLDTAHDRLIHVRVEGPGRLLAHASGRPITEERFEDPGCITFDGRTLVIVRPTGPGEIVVTASAEGCVEAVATVTACEAG